MTLENSEKFEEIRVHRASTFIAKLGRNFISRVVFLARGLEGLVSRKILCRRRNKGCLM